MRYAFFLGCTVPIRAPNYEASARAVAKELGIELVDFESFSCCGFPAKAVKVETTILMAARNLAIAEKEGLDIITLCNACSETLTDAAHILNHNNEVLERVNQILKPMGYEYKGSVKVRHIARFLYEDIGIEKIKEKVTKPLVELKIAAYPGCHFTKPSHIYEGFDSPEHPESLNRLVEATGASVVKYESSCCGGGILGIKEETALKMTNFTLSNIKETGADAMVLVCPFCNVMYEQNQKKVEKTFEASYNLPVLYYPQLLGLAMGIDKENLGFSQNRIKVDKIFEKLTV